MNSVFIVLPILTLLMFDLGLTLSVKNFSLFLHRPRAVLAGLIGQIILLPLLAFVLTLFFHLPPAFSIGILLIACCPGGSSSNIFSMIAKGDVALSVTLTALSSIITLITIPIIMNEATLYWGHTMERGITLPVKNLLIQNFLLMLLPILLGIFLHHYCPALSKRLERVLSKIAFPALILLASLFFVQHYATIKSNLAQLGGCILLLLLSSIALASLLAVLFRVNEREKRTIVIEVGMQNAAQAIAIASSPFIYDNGIIAIPAIVYALFMNLVLLIYVAFKKRGN